mmetsp:Transcript_30916/g.104124  ORF Transcript_30916/g.104124 Transcript_30916/m.104124 type:complete len:82 (-) Transcript_30916:87-332(-)
MAFPWSEGQGDSTKHSTSASEVGHYYKAEQKKKVLAEKRRIEKGEKVVKLPSIKSLSCYKQGQNTWPWDRPDCDKKRTVRA